MSLFILVLQLALMVKFLFYFFTYIESFTKYLPSINFFPLSIVLILAFPCLPLFNRCFFIFLIVKRAILVRSLFHYTFLSSLTIIMLISLSKLFANSNVRSASVTISEFSAQCYSCLFTRFSKSGFVFMSRERMSGKIYSIKVK